MRENIIIYGHEKSFMSNGKPLWKFDTSNGKINIFDSNDAEHLNNYAGLEIEVDLITNTRGYKEIKEIYGVAKNAAPKPLQAQGGANGNKDKYIIRQNALYHATSLVSNGKLDIAQLFEFAEQCEAWVLRSEHEKA